VSTLRDLWMDGPETDPLNRFNDHTNWAVDVNRVHVKAHGIVAFSSQNANLPGPILTRFDAAGSGFTAVYSVPCQYEYHSRGGTRRR
jgi:hypothetical protein